MDLNEIRILIDRFEKGDTSLEEEKRISQFFHTMRDIPAEFSGYRLYFLAMHQKRNVAAPTVIPGVLKSAETRKSATTIQKVFLTPFWFKSVAATILILLAIGLTIRISNPEIFTGKKKYSEEEKRKAYHQTMTTLAYVGNILNKGAEPVSYLGKFDEEIENVGKMEKLTSSLNQVSKISKLNIINIDYQNK